MFFEKTNLKSLGLRLQLGHLAGIRCPNPHPWDNFVVIDNSGIHSLAIDFCACGASSHSHAVQLLHFCLFPATVIKPKMAATFATLKILEILSYESKVSAFQFYNSLVRLTDNTGMNIPKVRHLTILADCFFSPHLPFRTIMNLFA